MDRETILRAAFERLAFPGTPIRKEAPAGYWPDIGRLAVEMALQGTLEPVLDKRMEEIVRKARKVSHQWPKEKDAKKSFLDAFNE